ncbi:hypothetical protein SRHO_G00200580 [Serrasalmus rhombeus]
MQSQRGNNLTGEETAGKPPQEPPSPQNLRCFQDVLHIVSSLTDREWRTLSEDVPHAVTKLQFATLCTKIILSDSKSAVQSYLPSLLRVIGMEAVLRAEQNVREKAECASVNPSGSNTAEETSHKRSPVDQSDLICHIVEDFASEVKMAMESLLQMSQLQHPKRSSDPVPDTSCVRNSQLRDPGQGPSSLNYFVVDETVVTLLKHLLSLNTRSSPAADPSTSAGSKGQDRHSDKSPVDPSDLICHIVEDFVSEVKIAMEQSVCKVASCEESSCSKDWKTTCSLVAKEMMTILEGKMRHSQPQDTKDQREKQHGSKTDTEALTGKIIVVVLDVLEGNSAERTDHKTSDLLRATAERLIQTATTSAVEERMSRQRPPDLDLMLEAMARSGFPTDLMQSHLDAMSTDIVNTIQDSIDTFSSTSTSVKIRKFRRPLSSDTAKDSMMHHIFHRINEKVKMFFTVSKQFVKKRSTEPQQNTVSSSASQTSLIDHLTISCTNDVIGGITRLYHPGDLSSDSHRSTGGKTSQLSVASKLKVHRVTQELEKMIGTSRSSSKWSLECTDLEESLNISSLESMTVTEMGYCSSSSLQHIKSLFDCGFQEKAIQVVSDALFKTCGKMSTTVSIHSRKEGSEEVDMRESQPMPSYSSSVLVESAASDITNTFLNGLQKMSSDKVDKESLTEPAPSPKTFRSAARRLYRNVQYKIFGFLLSLQESQSGTESLLSATEFESNNQRLKPAESLHTDDSKIPPSNKAYTDSCMDGIINREDPVIARGSFFVFFVDESVETLLKLVLSLNSRSSPVADPSSTSAGSKGQDRHSDN